MGCNSSKAEKNVVNSTGRNNNKNNRRKLMSTRSMSSISLHEDLLSNLIQHRVVEDISEYFEFYEVIGSGHFGSVGRAISKRSGKTWAVKEVQLSNAVNKESLQNEMNILKCLHHPQIVRVISSYEDKEYMYMVMELCKGNSLYDLLYGDYHRVLDENQIRRIVRGLLRAVAFLHSNFVTHRDLKLENLLLDSMVNPTSVKVCDFGLSTHFKKGEKLEKTLGTIDYVAPEVLDGEYNEKCDLWSVGVICYELFTGVSPFHADTIDETMHKIYDGKLQFQDDVWKQFSPNAIHFIKSLVMEDVDKRLSAQQALEHKWIKMQSTEEIASNDRMKDQKKILLTNMLNFSSCRKMKQTALLSVAVGMSDDHFQREMAAEVFHSMDYDCNGMLSREEFCRSMVESGLAKADANELFDRIDQSKNGSINFLEFMAACMDQRDIGQNTIKEAFNILDNDRKGRISIRGLREVFKHSLMPDEIKEMVSSADKNGDGFVDYDDFEAMIKGTPRSGNATLDNKPPKVNDWDIGPATAATTKPKQPKKINDWDLPTRQTKKNNDWREEVSSHENTSTSEAG